MTRSLCTPPRDPTLDRAQDICDTLVDLYERGALDEIYLVFTHSYSAMRMEPEIIKLLPLDRAMLSARRGLSEADQYRDVVRYEPSPEAVLDVLVPGVIRGYIFAALVESFCSEQSSRMTRHGFRQSDKRQGHAENAVPRVTTGPAKAAITQEITEIAGGRRGPEPAVERRFVLRMLPGVAPEKP